MSYDKYDKYYKYDYTRFDRIERQRNNKNKSLKIKNIRNTKKIARKLMKIEYLNKADSQDLIFTNTNTKAKVITHVRLCSCERGFYDYNDAKSYCNICREIEDNCICNSLDIVINEIKTMYNTMYCN